MKGSIRQRSPGSWELTIDAGRDPLGKRQRKYVTVPGTKAQTQRKLRELLSAMDRGIHISTEKILLRDWLNPAQLTRAVKSLGARCGVPNLTVRSLRHFHASVMLQSGQNPWSSASGSATPTSRSRQTSTHTRSQAGRNKPPTPSRKR